MEQAICQKAATVGFWDGYARWYKLWMEHNAYHDNIIDVLMTKAIPGWKVLDIGAGNGVLSMPLCAIGCDVTALEPSVGMRSLLYAEAFKRGIDWLKVDDRPWEETTRYDYSGHDLIMACNSLHLTPGGYSYALDRMFQSAPKSVFVVSELYPGLEFAKTCGPYEATICQTYEIESSFAYHDMSEVLDHWTFKKGGELNAWDIVDIQARLKERDGHLWIDDTATVGMFWWERQEC